MTDEHGKRFQHDPKWKGPLKGRSCTDCFCLIIFLAFISGWAGIGFYVYRYGDPNVLLVPTDSEGRRCGIDIDVVDKKNLFFFDLTKCLSIAAIFGCDTPQVCVKDCPNNHFLWEKNRAEDELTVLRKITICQMGTNVSDATMDQLQRYIDNDTCARYYLESTSVSGRCIPNVIPPPSTFNFTKTVWELFDNTTGLGKLLVNVREDGEKAINDIEVTRWVVMVMLGWSAVVSVIYILLMRWLATPIVFVSIVGFSGLLGYTTYILYLLYAEKKSNFWLVLTIICGVMLAIFLLVCIFLRNRIRLACQLIGEASKAVTSALSTLIFPVLPCALHILVSAYALVVGVYILTLRGTTYTIRLGGNCKCPEELGYTNGTTCLPEVFNSSCMEDGGYCVSGGCYSASTRRLWFSNYMLAFNIVGSLWLFFFVSAFGEMVLAGTFATWYWTFKKSDVPFFTLTASLWRTLRYHVGTLAFGSLIITICRMIRLVLEYIDGKLKKYDNALVSFLLKCMRCYFWLLEKFLKFLNRNAYIMCSIHGKAFCPSAKDAFSLLMRNIIRVFVLDKITDWLLFMGKILITGIVACSAWWWITTEYSTIQYLPVPITLVAIVAYAVASVFFSVYSMAVDTLFLCFLEDSERNDGTSDKPYYMSKGLLRVLRKS